MPNGHRKLDCSCHLKSEQPGTRARWAVGRQPLPVLLGAGAQGTGMWGPMAPGHCRSSEGPGCLPCGPGLCQAEGTALGKASSASRAWSCCSQQPLQILPPPPENVLEEPQSALVRRPKATLTMWLWMGKLGPICRGNEQDDPLISGPSRPALPRTGPRWGNTDLARKRCRKSLSSIRLRLASAAGRADRVLRDGGGDWSGL